MSFHLFFFIMASSGSQHTTLAAAKGKKGLFIALALDFTADGLAYMETIQHFKDRKTKMLSTLTFLVAQA